MAPTNLRIVGFNRGLDSAELDDKGDAELFSAGESAVEPLINEETRGEND